MQGRVDEANDALNMERATHEKLQAVFFLGVVKMFKFQGAVRSKFECNCCFI